MFYRVTRPVRSPDSLPSYSVFEGGNNDTIRYDTIRYETVKLTGAEKRSYNFRVSPAAVIPSRSDVGSRLLRSPVSGARFVLLISLVPYLPITQRTKSRYHGHGYRSSDHRCSPCVFSSFGLPSLLSIFRRISAMVRGDSEVLFGTCRYLCRSLYASLSSSLLRVFHVGSWTISCSARVFFRQAV